MPRVWVFFKIEGKNKINGVSVGQVEIKNMVIGLITAFGVGVAIGMYIESQIDKRL